MTPYALGRPPRSSNQEVFEGRDDHTEDVATIYRRIVDMEILGIEAGLFEEDNP